MISGRIRRTGQGNSWGWVAVVLAGLGLLFLYQREGGKVFGPQGLVRHLDSTPVTGITAKWDTGLLSHDLLLTYSPSTDSRLEDVHLTVALYREDGQQPELTLVWAN